MHETSTQEEKRVTSDTNTENHELQNWQKLHKKAHKAGIKAVANVANTQIEGGLGDRVSRNEYVNILYDELIGFSMWAVKNLEGFYLGYDEATFLIDVYGFDEQLELKEIYATNYLCILADAGVKASLAIRSKSGLRIATNTFATSSTI